MYGDRRRQTAAWFFFGIVLLAVCILSFQSGAATRVLDGPFVDRLTEEGVEAVSRERVDRLIFYIRQTGRAVIFFILGGSWGLAAFLSFQKCTLRRRLLLGLAVLLMISYVTEKAKIFIEGRHYRFVEFVESFLFCMLGCLLADGLLRRLRRRRGKQESQGQDGCDGQML